MHSHSQYTRQMYTNKRDFTCVKIKKKPVVQLCRYSLRCVRNGPMHFIATINPITLYLHCALHHGTLMEPFTADSYWTASTSRHSTPNGCVRNSVSYLRSPSSLTRPYSRTSRTETTRERPQWTRS